MDAISTVRTFHDGELAVQRRAGVADQAARLAGMLAPADLGGGLGLFLAGRTFAALTARARDGRLWVSPLTGAPGFLAPRDRTRLHVAAVPAPGDPLRELPAGQQVGMIVIEHAARRRLRVNGRLAAVDPEGLLVEVEQAYGNCPQHIPPRTMHVATAADATTRAALTRDQVALVEATDTFVLGTTHPERGSDASHRGGVPGFVRVEGGDRLVWDDLPGNQMFNTFGNLAVDPSAAVLVVDPATGRPLHLSGTATVRWDVAGSVTGRQVELRVEAVVG